MWDISILIFAYVLFLGPNVGVRRKVSAAATIETQESPGPKSRIKRAHDSRS